eukprot:2920536-Lingulodinium_polyedra.AAC.1
MVRAWRVRACVARCGTMKRRSVRSPHRCAAFLETLRNDVVERAFRHFGAPQCGSRARAPCARHFMALA